MFVGGDRDCLRVARTFGKIEGQNVGTKIVRPSMILRVQGSANERTGGLFVVVSSSE